jgi:predicted nucleic acid-binding protein
MIILDTSVWIEFLRAKPDYFGEVKTLLDDRMIMGLEWIFGELLQGARDRRERDVILSYWHALPKIDEAGLWLDAGRISSEERLHIRGVGLIDCTILAAARRSGAKIWTLDRKLAGVLASNEKYM